MTKSVILSYLLFGLSIVSGFVHNAIYGLFLVEEPVFFMLNLIFFLAFLISVFYNIVIYMKTGKPKDLWKLGWIGLFGLIALVPGFSYGLFGFFGFFGFFGAKK